MQRLVKNALAARLGPVLDKTNTTSASAVWFSLVSGHFTNWKEESHCCFDCEHKCGLWRETLNIFGNGGLGLEKCQRGDILLELLQWGAEVALHKESGANETFRKPQTRPGSVIGVKCE